MTVSNPPLSQNFAIGCVGKVVSTFGIEPDGSHISHGTHVQPLSLFRAQLEARIGPERAEAVLGK
jgi:hypothetical protein